MQPLVKRVQELLSQIEAAFLKLNIEGKQNQALQLESDLSEPEAWNDSNRAQEDSRRLAEIKALISPWIDLMDQAQDTLELINTEDESLAIELKEKLDGLEADLQNYRKDLLFDGEFDDHNAILRLSAGVGGTDAQDWTEMLERMYLRWAEKSHMQSRVIESSAGEEAGIKSSVIEVNGPYAFGKLKGENGVHRLVRLSPFNSDNLRQTSFALVEVLPQIDAPEEIDLDDKDLKIDVYRAGGHGGQSVNTTDSAVRVTHTPTSTTVAIQNERSQLQNKEMALKILRSKLAQMQLEQHAKNIAELRAGESANWGSQIRNYVLHPYTMVKDTRTKHEERDAKAVLDGSIDGFIDSYLQAN